MSNIQCEKFDNKGYNWIVRNAEPNDAANLIKLISKVESETEYMLRDSGEFDVSEEEEIEYIKEKLAGKKQLFIIAEMDNKIVGLLNFEGNTLKRYNHQGKFAMGVLKEYWGNSIGSSLIKKMLEWCDENKIIRVALEVMEKNVDAINLYRKFNFIEEGVLKKDCYYGNRRFENTIIMALIKELEE